MVVECIYLGMCIAQFSTGSDDGPAHPLIYELLKPFKNLPAKGKNFYLSVRCQLPDHRDSQPVLKMNELC